ncbi:MAG: hypothetical protein P1U77_27855 [Rubripirellula sp.]|nr:hypothetical protein [Rubripirellula sp.]
MIIHKPRYEVIDGEARIIADVQCLTGCASLRYSVDEKYASYLTTRLDGFLVGLLILAMKNGEDIELKGSVSPRLFYNLTNYYMEIVQHGNPRLKKVRIIPDQFEIAGDDEDGNSVVTGFSGGIDSWCCLAEHLSSSQIPNEYKLTHLISNNVGAHQAGSIGDLDRQRILAKERFDLQKPVAEDLGLEFIRTDSNLGELLQMHSIQTHVPSNVSVVLQLQKLFSKFYYASCYHYTSSFIGPANDIAYADPAAVHLLSTESLECISSGCQHTRVEKTRIISGFSAAQKSLNVCLRPLPQEGEANCSFCKKCCRTLLTLEVLGELDRFRGVFDLDRWGKIRLHYIFRVLRKNTGYFEREIKNFAAKEGRKLHKWQGVLALIARLIPSKLDRKLWKKAVASLRSQEESR